MCYGDPDYGRDGYYRRYLQEAEEAAYYRRMEEERELEENG
jgi:hypothetical protein